MLELLAMVSLGLAWLVPNHYPPWTSFYSESLTALGLVLLVLALGRLNWSTRGSPAVGALLLASAIPSLQWLGGPIAFSGDAVVATLYLAGMATAVSAGQAWASIDPRRAASALFATTVAAATASAVIGLAQAFDAAHWGIWTEESYSGMRAVGNLGQPNNLATLIGFGLLGVFYLRERDRLAAPVAAFVAVLLVAGLAVTQSRTALLFGPVIALGLWVAARRGVPLATSRRTILVLVVLHWSLTLTWPALRAILLSLPPNTATTRLAEGSVRTQMWPLLFDASMQSPWTGFGWLQVGAAQLSVADTHPATREFWMHAHNLFLDLVLWCGYPAGLLLSGAVVLWYINRARRVRTLESVTALLAITAFGIHAMLELPHHYAYFLIPVSLWIGQVEATTVAGGPLSPRWNLLAPALGLVLLLGIWRDYSAIEEDFRLVRFEILRIGDVRASKPAPSAPFLSGLTAFLRFSRTEPRPGMNMDELRFMSAVARRYAYAPSLYRLARALALNGQLDEAVRTLRKLQHMHGDGNLTRIQADLRERVANGEVSLEPLEREVARFEPTEVRSN